MGETVITMAKTMTLAQAARQMEESGAQIKIGNFDTFADFMSYFGLHYKPMLEHISEGYTPAQERARLLRFFADDMLSAFSEEEN